jgi:hypothetical protein
MFGATVTTMACNAVMDAEKRIMGAVAPAGEATVWRGCCRISAHQFAYTAGKRLGLRFRTRQTTVELNNPGALVKMPLPIFRRPALSLLSKGFSPHLLSPVHQFLLQTPLFVVDRE